jgi:hypothetical protein
MISQRNNAPVRHGDRTLVDRVVRGEGLVLPVVVLITRAQCGMRA